MSSHTSSFHGITITVNDATDEILQAHKKAKERGLFAVGEAAEGHAKENILDAGIVDTGRLLNSISHKEDSENVFIGTNVDYAPYMELGTGIYASSGAGRKDPWVYRDEKGNFHFTRGVKPVHFLKKSATEHTKEYKNLIKDSLENA